MLTRKEAKAVIAARAGKGFYKSYITNVRLVATREIPGHKMGWCERDYTFEHKGKSYRINEEIVADAEGNKIYSAERKWTVKEI